MCREEVDQLAGADIVVMPLLETLGGARRHVGPAAAAILGETPIMSPAAKGAAGLMLAGNFVPL